MSGFLGSLRSLVFGETWTIPLGVAGTLVAAVALRSAVSDDLWSHAGGFVIAALVALTLALALRGARRQG